MIQRKVKIFHHITGEMAVTRAFAKIALDVNHMKNGGAYCTIKEIPRYYVEVGTEEEEDNLDLPFADEADVVIVEENKAEPPLPDPPPLDTPTTKATKGTHTRTRAHVGAKKTVTTGKRITTAKKPTTGKQG